MKTDYITLSPVDHDNVRYETGAAIALADEHAKPLLHVGAIAPQVTVAKDAAAENTPDTPPAGKERNPEGAASAPSGKRVVAGKGRRTGKQK